MLPVVHTDSMSGLGVGGADVLCAPKKESLRTIILWDLLSQTSDLPSPPIIILDLPPKIVDRFLELNTQRSHPLLEKHISSAVLL